MNYYVLVLEEKIKSFSLVGHGEHCAVSLKFKGNTQPLDGVNSGDKVIGYVAGSSKTFSYLFTVGVSEGTAQPYFKKTFESSSGASLSTLSKEIQELISSKEQTDSFISITDVQYTEITQAMINALLTGDTFANTASVNLPSPSVLEKDRNPGGSNVLLYGVPGSGKSWTIEHEYCHPGSHIERLVFHPDYTSSDFIGQILPVVDKKKDNQVTYEFTPGPFTTILRDAYAHPQQDYILIIEELNRGNAPAIFGEVFQLLDRMVAPKTIDGIEYHVGTSEYEVTNKNIAEIVYHDPSKKIRIPSNLSILATMNTSDQNVFTLDTAFQRRWKMRLIENSFDNVRLSLADCSILDTGVKWKRFCEVINKQIVGNKAKMASSEDKRLGVYFVHENDLKHNDADKPINHDTIRAELNELLAVEMKGALTPEQKNRLKAIRDALMQNRIFPEKVIKYLWDDAFKFNPEAIFDTKDNKELDSLEAVIRMFVYENREKDRFRIFNSTIRDLLYEP